MQLWEIILPNEANDGESYAHAHSEARAILLDSFSGYTVIAADGGWRDSGQIYDEPVTIYRVLSESTPEIKWAFELFPDQLAICINLVGAGWIVRRSCQSIDPREVALEYQRVANQSITRKA